MYLTTANISNNLLIDENDQYLELYVKKGSWWLDYLKATDEKVNTRIIINNLLNSFNILNRSHLNVLDIGSGEGSAILPVTDYISANYLFPYKIDLIEPSPYLYSILNCKFKSNEFNKNSIYVQNCSFQLFNENKKYNLIFAMNSLNGFISKSNTIHFNRILNLLDEDGVCVFILQSRKGKYKEIQQMLNGYKHKTKMLNAEIFIDILEDNKCNFEKTYFESKLHIDLSLDGIKKNKGLYSLWFRENIDYIKEKKLLSIISKVRKQLSILTGDITIGNYVFVLKKNLQNE